MRCLYCGKHLPLLRKLTGGGEFCSDAHRDKYHDEYNRLAVSRLLQAQTRPEEIKPTVRAEEPRHVQPEAQPAVARSEQRMLKSAEESPRKRRSPEPVVAPEPAIAKVAEPEIVPPEQSYISEFRIGEVAPAPCPTIAVLPEHEPEPIPAADIALPPLVEVACAPLFAVRFVEDRPAPREIEIKPREVDLDPIPSDVLVLEPAIGISVNVALETGVGRPRMAQMAHWPAGGGARPYRNGVAKSGEAIAFAAPAAVAPRLAIAPDSISASDGQTPRDAEPLRSIPEPRRFTNWKLFEISLDAVAPNRPSPAPPPFVCAPILQGLAGRPPVQFELTAMAPLDESDLDLEQIERFGGIASSRPWFDSGLQLLSESEEPDGPPIVSQPALAAVPEASPENAGDPAKDAAAEDENPVAVVTEPLEVSPRRVLQALAQMKIELRPADSEEPPIDNSLKPMSIPASVPAPAALVAGFESAPLSAKPRLLRYTLQPLRPKMALGTETGPLAPRANGVHLASAKNGKKGFPESPKSMPKSMLHLEDDTVGGDESETVSLFGRIGGLFGKKNRNA